MAFLPKLRNAPPTQIPSGQVGKIPLTPQERNRTDLKQVGVLDVESASGAPHPEGPESRLGMVTVCNGQGATPTHPL